MPEWLQFSILDMTPYNRQGWFGLIETYLQDYPYIALCSLVFCALLAFLTLRPPPFSQAPRLVLGLLAFSWFWCGAVFQMQYHATLNWAAPQFAWIFLAQTALLALAAIFGKTLSWPQPSTVRGHWPSLLILTLALIYPAVGFLEGRVYGQLEWFGLMPTPTTLATLGFILILSGTWRWVLLPIPVLWALISSAFTLKLDLYEPYIFGLALCLCAVSAVTKKRSG